MLHEYTEQLYLPAAGAPMTAGTTARRKREPIVTEAG
jgi:hypothetical protein